MILITTLLNLLGLLLNFIGFIGVYKHRENIFGRVSTADINNLKQHLNQETVDASSTVTNTILKKVTKANDYFICILVGFLLEFISVGISLIGLIGQTS